MSGLYARILLARVAGEFQRERQAYSRQEIASKINEIKYLSAQKKVPKITLRKEIIHLEHKLGALLGAEESLLRQKQRESARVALLKKQIASLQKRLAAVSEKDLQQKVDVLSRLLADYLAQRKTREEVQSALWEIGGETPPGKVPVVPFKRQEVGEKSALTPAMMARVSALQQRIRRARQELQQRENGEKGHLWDILEQLEKQLQKYYDQFPELLKLPEETAAISGEAGGEAQPGQVRESPVEMGKVRHTILFSPEFSAPEPPAEASGGVPAFGRMAEGFKIEDLEIEKELPLPPPPRITKPGK